MGLLIEGTWHNNWYGTKSSSGQFIREDAQFRNWITKEGKPGPTGRGEFPAERDRYHLYVSLACPWAHRTIIFRTLKGLEGIIGITIVHPDMLENGWEFDTTSGSTNDVINGFNYLHQLYTAAVHEYSGRVTVPVLWDKKTNAVVSNESSEIIRMLNSAFDHLTGNSLDFYPEALRAEIDSVNELIYATVNNGVYRTGFATSQEAYESAFDALFDTLDLLDARLGSQRYLTGGQLTEADWRLFTTLVRFDAVYHGHFKANQMRIADYSNLSEYVRDLYQMPGISETVNFTHIKQHYYVSQRTINPTQIVPKGPMLDLDQPHGRARLS